MSSAESHRPLIPLLAALAIAVALLVLPFPGSLSVQVTRAAALTFGGTPGIELVSQLSLVALAVAILLAVGILTVGGVAVLATAHGGRRLRGRASTPAR